MASLSGGGQRTEIVSVNEANFRARMLSTVFENPRQKTGIVINGQPFRWRIENGDCECESGELLCLHVYNRFADPRPKTGIVINGQPFRRRIENRACKCERGDLSCLHAFNSFANPRPKTGNYCQQPVFQAANREQRLQVRKRRTFVIACFQQFLQIPVQKPELL